MSVIWRFEEQIIASCGQILSSILEMLDCRMSPEVFLVGISLDTNRIVVIPEEAPVSWQDLQEAVGGVDMAPASYPADDDMPDDEWGKAFERYQKFIWSCWGQFRDGLKEVVEPCGLIVSVSPCVEINRHMVGLAIAYNRAEYERYPHLDMSVFTERGRWPSLPFGVVEAVLDEFGEELRKIDAGRRHFETTEAGRILRVAGEFFTRCNVWESKRFSPLDVQIRGTLDFFEACNAISAMPLESRQGFGGMIVADAGHKAVNVALRNQFPVLADNHRRVRKLVEMCQSGLSVLTDSRNVWGLGTFIRENYEPDKADVMMVRFAGNGRWFLAHLGQDLMEVDHGVPKIARPRVNPSEVRSRLASLFGEMPSLDSLVNAVGLAVEARHGTILVIARNAIAEVRRLVGEHSRLVPLTLDQTTMAAATAIDGAVILDIDGVCHGIGVILDGEAGPNESAARGSRYNSTVRYLRRNPECLVVIVSEDGMIDVLPLP
ncbi:MAG: DNA integrity scanning protein DisA nucleotide-binding domain protein [Planctomycetes bacterium]|nr:DNA integrity scanning protein DisA nucleotide-binding domain protein [Planctomycetota bacterium]